MNLFGLKKNMKTAANEVEDQRFKFENECKARDELARTTTNRFEQSLLELESILAAARSE